MTYKYNIYMRKLFTLCFGLFAALAIQAQNEFPLQFADQYGNVIADGSTLSITESEDDGFGGILMPSGLYVKNTSSDEVRCGGSFDITQMSNGAFQSCFPTNCMQASNMGSYTTQNGAVGAGELKSMQTEWLPTAEGSCTVTYQLLTYKYNAITSKWIVDKYGPTVTLNFSYSTSGISAVKAEESVTCYDLQGRRVVHPSKGLYIVNGKKIFINKNTNH